MCGKGQGSRINLAGDDPEHVVVVPGGLFTPTAKAGLTAAISGDEVESVSPAVSETPEWFCFGFPQVSKA
jgi:hypothetical protein